MRSWTVRRQTASTTKKTAIYDSVRQPNHTKRSISSTDKLWQGRRVKVCFLSSLHSPTKGDVNKVFGIGKSVAAVVSPKLRKFGGWVWWNEIPDVICMHSAASIHTATRWNFRYCYVLLATTSKWESESLQNTYGNLHKGAIAQCWMRK